MAGARWDKTAAQMPVGQDDLALKRDAEPHLDRPRLADDLLAGRSIDRGIHRVHVGVLALRDFPVYRIAVLRFVEFTVHRIVDQEHRL